MAVLAALWGNAWYLIVTAEPVAFALFAKTFFRHRFKKQFRRTSEKIMAGVSTFTFTEDGVEIETPLGHSSNQWDCFKGWQTRGKFPCIELNDNRFVLVNREKISQRDLDELMRLLKAHVTVQ